VKAGGPDGCRCASVQLLVPRTVRMALHPESASGPVIWMRVSFASSAGARRHDSVGAGVPDWVAGVCAEPERSQLAWAIAVTNAARPEGRPS